MKNVIPALADLTQDIAGPIPVDLIQNWVESRQSDTDHDSILEPHKRLGAFVSSDSAGLSKLSAGRPLIEVMKLVSEPKEIIFSHGSAIGGQAVGIWSADNTQMFYDRSIDVNDIVEQMIASQHAISNILVDVGIGIHSGSAYEIGGGLYGVDAHTIETFTEKESNGKEIIISSVIKDQLKQSLRIFSAKRGVMQVINYSDIHPASKAGTDVHYPAPFDRSFHDDLLSLDVTDHLQVEALHNKRVTESTIVLFRIFHDRQIRLLDGLVRNLAANAVIHNICRNHAARIIKSNGTLSIISCDRDDQAVNLSMALMRAARENDFVANVGVSKGECLIFDLENGLSDLAGGLVNIASKLAEDTDERGRMFFDETIADYVRSHGIGESFELEVSGVNISGVKVDPLGVNFEAQI